MTNIREIQIKTTSARMTTINKAHNAQDCQGHGTACILKYYELNEKVYHQFGKQFANFL